jgi:hypothetical protein
MANTPATDQPASPSMEIPEGVETVYVNIARIVHSPADLVIDFAHILPGERKATVRARVLMSPLSAKLLLRALSENLARYEAAFGEINVPGNTSLAEHLFRPHQPPDDTPPKPKED